MFGVGLVATKLGDVIVGEDFSDGVEGVGAERGYLVRDLGREVGFDEVKRVAFFFPTLSVGAVGVEFKASNVGGEVDALFGARGVFEGGGDDGWEHGVVDFVAFFLEGFVVDLTVGVGVSEAEVGVEVFEGGAFGAVERGAHEEGCDGELGFAGVMDEDATIVVFVVFAGDVFFEGESVVFALAFRLVFVEDAGSFEVDVFAVAAEEDVGIFDVEHTEVGDGLGGVGAEFDLLGFDNATHDVGDEVGIAT